jgi:phospholipid/cholesterol/gamma-HCH transport system substrate-binding protein
MRRQLRYHGKWLIVIALFALLAGVAATWIFVNQRLRTPLADRYELRVAFESTQGLTGGLGQPVNVAGVRVGDIVSTELEDGRSVATLSIEGDRLPHVYRDARAALRPNTPLEDMQIELYPGRRAAGEIADGGLVGVSRTDVPVDSEEFTAILDADTRAYLDGLITAVARGSRGRGKDLRAALEQLGPTTAQLRELNGSLAARRRQIRRVVRNLSLVVRAAGSRDRDLRGVVSGANATLGALAREDTALRESLELLPGTLTSARTSLGRAERLAGGLPATLDALTESAHELPGALRATQGMLDSASPTLAQLRPFLRESQPVSRDIASATRRLERVAPDLRTSFSLLDRVANALAYNPPGSEEGYLYWTTWFFHNVNSVFSGEDAHGAFSRGLFVAGGAAAVTASGKQRELAPIEQFLTGRRAGR